MWDCGYCGCQAIAGSLTFCPMCFKEPDVPKTTAEGGGSNGLADPGPEAAPEPEVAAIVPDPASVPKVVLQDLAEAQGLPTSGTKAELADALTEAAAPEPVVSEVKSPATGKSK